MKLFNVVSACAAIAAVSCASTSSPVQEADSSMEDLTPMMFETIFKNANSSVQGLPMTAMYLKLLELVKKAESLKSQRDGIEFVMKEIMFDMVDKLRGPAKWEEVLNAASKADGPAANFCKEVLAQAAADKDLDIEVIFQSMKEQPDRYISAIDAALKSDSKEKRHKVVIDAVFKEFKQGGNNIWYWVAGISGGFIVVVGGGTLVYFFFVRPKKHF